MLFFKLPTKQKLILLLLLGTVGISYCSGPKKVAGSNNHKSTTEKVTKNDGGKNHPAPETLEPATKPDDNTDKKEKSSNKAEKVISTARTFIGTPYKYGG